MDGPWGKQNFQVRKIQDKSGEYPAGHRGKPRLVTPRARSARYPQNAEGGF